MRKGIGRVCWVARKSNSKETSPDIKWSLCPAFVCRQKEVKRAVLSRAANLWSYLLDKSIAVSESRAECAGGELEGLPLARCPPGPSWGVPACLFTLHLFCLSAPILQLLSLSLPTHKHSHTHTHATRATYTWHRVTSCSTIYTMTCNRGPTV